MARSEPFSARDDRIVEVDERGLTEPTRELIRVAVEAVLVDAGTGGEISVAVLPDREMRRLNRRHLGRNGPTDVIAFSLGEEFRPLGDVYLGGEQAARQAEDHGIPLEEELVRLAIHGTLHVLGHDHSEGEDRTASSMFRLQERLVARVTKEALPGRDG